MSLRSEMTCKNCARFLQDPISFPCFCVFCREHLYDDSAKSGSIQCNKCSKSFEISESDFIANNLITSILKKELHLTDEEKSVKISLYHILNRLDQLQNMFKVKETDSEEFSYCHFSEIRRKIDIQRERLKARIDEIALNLIEQTNDKERIYISKVNSLLLGFAHTDIPKANQAVLDEFRKPNLVIDEVKRLLNEHEQKISQLQCKLAEFDVLNNEIKPIEFRAEQEFQNASFGYLSNHDKLLCGFSDQPTKIWDLKMNACVYMREGHTNEVRCLDFFT